MDRPNLAFPSRQRLRWAPPGLLFRSTGFPPKWTTRPLVQPAGGPAPCTRIAVAVAVGIMGGQSREDRNDQPVGPLPGAAEKSKATGDSSVRTLFIKAREWSTQENRVVRWSLPPPSTGSRDGQANLAAGFSRVDGVGAEPKPSGHRARCARAKRYAAGGWIPRSTCSASRMAA